MPSLADMSITKLKEEAWRYDTDNPKLQPLLDELLKRGIPTQMSRSKPQRVIAFYAAREPS